MRGTLAACGSSLLLILMVLAAGCASRGVTPLAEEAEPHAQKQEEETTKRKSPPFFIYRPGAGLTIVAPVRL